MMNGPSPTAENRSPDSGEQLLPKDGDSRNVATQKRAQRNQLEHLELNSDIKEQQFLTQAPGVIVTG